jgi:LysM repeat protein
MPILTGRILLTLAVAQATAFQAFAQAPAAAGPRIEPGLEIAVRWIWKVEPSPAATWGLPLPAIPVPTPSSLPTNGASVIPHATSPGIPSARPDSYTVQRGDALYTIGKRYKVPVDLLKEVNGLTNNNIRIGQVLRIPSPEEVRARVPVSTPAPGPRKPNAPATPHAPPADSDHLAVQVFLDRQGFSAGPIDGQDSPSLQKTLQLFRESRPAMQDPAAFSQAIQGIGNPLTTYTLRIEDFRFIAPPRAARADAASKAEAHPKKSKSTSSTTVPQAKPSYTELTEAPMLAYRSPWEFVAERFHCDENYLRQLNAQIRDVPTVGTELRVPNVAPFAIERALAEPLQPPANPQNSITAAVVDLSRLEISKDGKLAAVFPLSIARPGLRGRDPWVIANAIPRPCLVTEQELRVKPQPQPRIFGRDDPSATPPPQKVHVPVHQTLAAGPNNPVGIIWINLTKAGSAEPLPYGLTGTSIPEHMRTQESIGGLRMANWDIARIVRYLPPGTPLEWKTSGPMAPPAVAQPAM